MLDEVDLGAGGRGNTGGLLSCDRRALHQGGVGHYTVHHDSTRGACVADDVRAVRGATTVDFLEDFLPRRATGLVHLFMGIAAAADDSA
jgi:hypothetical protein